MMLDMLNQQFAPLARLHVRLISANRGGCARGSGLPGLVVANFVGQAALTPANTAGDLFRPPDCPPLFCQGRRECGL